MKKLIQSIDQYNLPVGSSLNGTCREALMTHFQGWKKEYTAFTTSMPPYDSHATLITQSGFIYLRLDDASMFVSMNSTLRIKTYGEILGDRIWSGRVSPADLLLEYSSTLELDNIFYIPRMLGRRLTSTVGRLRNDNSINKLRLLENNLFEIQSDYCLLFTENLASCACRVLGSDITIIKVDPNAFVSHNITLVTVGWSDEIALGGAENLFNSFGNTIMHKVCIILFYLLPQFMCMYSGDCNCAQ